MLAAQGILDEERPDGFQFAAQLHGLGQIQPGVRVDAKTDTKPENVATGPGNAS